MYRHESGQFSAQWQAQARSDRKNAPVHGPPYRNDRIGMANAPPQSVSCIPNLDYAMCIGLLCSDLNASSLRKMIHCITQQIHPYLHEQYFITNQPDGFGYRYPEQQLLIFQLPLQHLNGLTELIAERILLSSNPLGLVRGMTAEAAVC